MGGGIAHGTLYAAVGFHSILFEFMGSGTCSSAACCVGVDFIAVGIQISCQYVDYCSCALMKTRHVLKMVTLWVVHHSLVHVHSCNRLLLFWAFVLRLLALCAPAYASCSFGSYEQLHLSIPAMAKVHVTRPNQAGCYQSSVITPSRLCSSAPFL